MRVLSACCTVPRFSGWWHSGQRCWSCWCGCSSAWCASPAGGMTAMTMSRRLPAAAGGPASAWFYSFRPVEPHRKGEHRERGGVSTQPPAALALFPVKARSRDGRKGGEHQHGTHQRGVLGRKACLLFGKEKDHNPGEQQPRGQRNRGSHENCQERRQGPHMSVRVPYLLRRTVRSSLTLRIYLKPRAPQ